MPQKGLKCVNCDTVFHPGCLKQLDNIQIIDTKSVMCCDTVNKTTIVVDDIANQDNLSFSSAIDQAEIASKLEISYLKELLNQKDTYIASLVDKVNILKEHIFLLNKINKMIPEPSIGTSSHSDPTLLTSLSDIKLNLQDSSSVSKTTTVKKPVIQKTTPKRSHPKSVSVVSPSEMACTVINPAPEVSSQVTTKRFNQTMLSSGILEANSKQTMSNIINLVKDVDSNNHSNRGRHDVTKRHQTKKTTIIGNNFEVSGLKGVPKHVILHVYRLDIDTTVNSLTSFLKDDFPEVKVEALSPKYPDLYTSFKVRIFERNFKQAMDPQVWPQGACVSRFLEKRRSTPSLQS